MDEKSFDMDPKEFLRDWLLDRHLPSLLHLDLDHLHLPLESIGKSVIYNTLRILFINQDSPGLWKKDGQVFVPIKSQM